MPECPNCHGYYFGNPSVCYKCNYDFKLRMVISDEEKIKRERQERIQREERIKSNTEQRTEVMEETNRIGREYEKKQLYDYIAANKPQQLLKNARYEYEVIIINDLPTGEIDYPAVKEAINAFASEGWRLTHAFTNEIGKTASTI